MNPRTQSTILVVLALVLPAVATTAALVLSLDVSLLIGTLVGIVLIYLALLVYLLQGGLEPLREMMESPPRIESIRESEFYDRFKPAVESARLRVEISYFDNTSPFDSADEAKIAYYEGIEEIIRKKEKVEFRRIIRALPGTKEWIERMVENLKGSKNFSLACVLDQNPESESLPHVSVQLIDSDLTFLVAVGEQREEQDPRDMFVRSEEFRRLWGRYFQRLWAESRVVVKRGVLDNHAFVDVKAHIERLNDGGSLSVDGG